MAGPRKPESAIPESAVPESALPDAVADRHAAPESAPAEAHRPVEQPADEQPEENLCAIVKAKFCVRSRSLFGTFGFILHPEQANESQIYIIVEDSKVLEQINLRDNWKEFINSLLRRRFQDTLDVPAMRIIENSMEDFFARGGDTELFNNIKNAEADQVQKKLFKLISATFNNPDIDLELEHDVELVTVDELLVDDTTHHDDEEPREVKVRVNLMLDPIGGIKCSRLSIGDQVYAFIQPEDSQKGAVRDIIPEPDAEGKPVPLLATIESLSGMPRMGIDISVRLAPNIIGNVLMMNDLKVKKYTDDPLAEAQRQEDADRAEQLAEQDHAELQAKIEAAHTDEQEGGASHGSEDFLNTFVLLQVVAIVLLIIVFAYRSCSNGY